ncbi:MAG: DUF84 family protein [Parcubacteria group bacterium]
MTKLKLALGSVSEQKLGYLKEILAEIGVSAEIFAHKAESGVAEQPMTSEETKAGSINRAKAALEAISQADCGIGIEIGYQKLEGGKYEIFCWTTITDRDGVVVSRRSQGFVMPNFYQEKLHEGKDLCDYVREYFKFGPDSVTRYVAEMIRGRKPFIIWALRDALVSYLKRNEF